MRTSENKKQLKEESERRNILHLYKNINQQKKKKEIELYRKGYPVNETKPKHKNKNKINNK